MDVRQRRLTADHQRLKALVESSGGTLSIESAAGDPPEVYVLLYKCRGIERLNSDAPVYRDSHRVQIRLPAIYPALQPLCTMLTPLYHPHVWQNNMVCLGKSWRPAEYLDLLALRLGAIIQCEPQYFDFEHPANREAAEWTRQHMSLFPLDTCKFWVPPDPMAQIQWTEMG